MHYKLSLKRGTQPRFARMALALTKGVEASMSSPAPRRQSPRSGRYHMKKGNLDRNIAIK